MANETISLAGFSVQVVFAQVNSMTLQVSPAGNIVLKAPIGTPKVAMQRFVQHSLSWLRSKTTHRPFLIEQSGVTIQVTYKDVRGITLAVKPDGTVRLSAPFCVTPDEIKRFVASKAEWLATHVMQKSAVRPVEIHDMPCDYGSEVSLFGQRKVLRHEPASVTPYIREDEGAYTLMGPDGLNVDARRAILMQWACEKLVAHTEKYVQHWLHEMHEAPLSKLVYRYMTSRWGSCRPDTRSVTINTRLVYYPLQVLESVVVHELCHLKEHSHSKRFYALCVRYLPDYMEREKLLK